MMSTWNTLYHVLGDKDEAAITPGLYSGASQTHLSRISLRLGQGNWISQFQRENSDPSCG